MCLSICRSLDGSTIQVSQPCVGDLPRPLLPTTHSRTPPVWTCSCPLYISCSLLGHCPTFSPAGLALSQGMCLAAWRAVEAPPHAHRGRPRWLLKPHRCLLTLQGFVFPAAQSNPALLGECARPWFLSQLCPELLAGTCRSLAVLPWPSSSCHHI